MSMFVQFQELVLFLFIKTNLFCSLFLIFM